MKYFFIFLLFFAFIHPASAANMVKGTVPQLEPLQPSPPGILPAYNKNIQYQDPNYVPSSGGSNAGQSSQNSQPAPGFVPEPSLVPKAQGAGSSKYIWWLGALVAAVVLGFLFFKRYRTK